VPAVVSKRGFIKIGTLSSRPKRGDEKIGADPFNVKCEDGDF
jgi:hypothetical protein